MEGAREKVAIEPPVFLAIGEGDVFYARIPLCTLHPATGAVRDPEKLAAIESAFDEFAWMPGQPKSKRK